MIASGLRHGRCGRNAGHSLLSLRAGKGRQAVCSPPPTIVSSSAQGILIDPLTADVPCTPHRAPADLAFGGSGHADTINSYPKRPHAAAFHAPLRACASMQQARWAYMEAQLCPDTPRSAISFSCSTRFPLQADAKMICATLLEDGNLIRCERGPFCPQFPPCGIGASESPLSATSGYVSRDVRSSTKGAGSHILIVEVRHPSVDNLPIKVSLGRASTLSCAVLSSARHPRR